MSDSLLSDENWRKQNKTIVSRLKATRRLGIFTDIVLSVQGQEFNCHKLILAIGSPFFERMFYPTFRNSSPSQCLKALIHISDVTPESFEIVLNFLYTDKVTFGNENQAFVTYEAATKFQMADLKSECEIYLSELEFRPGTVWSNLERASTLEMKKLQIKCINYVQNNAFICLKDETFLKTSGDVVMQIMQSEKLTISEIELANRVVSWSRTKNPSYLKTIMQPYLRLVRFKSMTPKEFLSFIERNRDLISAEDSLAILRHLEMPYTNNLPTWCCQLKKRINPDE